MIRIRQSRQIISRWLDMTPYEVAEIIDKEPLIASLLYDIDLLPEQIKEGDSRRYSYMLAVIGHMQAALAKADQAEEARGAAQRKLSDTYVLLDNATNAAQSAIGASWQLIETAPMDGSTILLSVPTLYGKWNKTIHVAGRWEERDPPTSGFWIIFNADEAVQRVEATHWMPLPAAPVASTSEREGNDG